MHQYPLRVAAAFKPASTESARSSPPSTTGFADDSPEEVVQNGYRQDLWNDDTFHPGMRQQRMHRVFKKV